MLDLESIYRRTLEACAPERIVRQSLHSERPGHVVAIGKCAGRLIDGVSFQDALCIIPRGYPPPASSSSRLQVVWGGHPDIDDESFRAGQQLLRFVDEHEDILFLMSGGGSACAEVPLPPFTTREVSAVNARLVASALPIGEINTVRKHLSAIKGGRLGSRVRGRATTLIYSDVSPGAIGDVASGPTVADASSNADAMRILERLGGLRSIIDKIASTIDTPKHLPGTSARIIAENSTLIAAAAGLIDTPVVLSDPIESRVEEAAATLADRAERLQPDQVLVAGGEPTVERRGEGKGGRCCELAVRFAMRSAAPALFGTSDGVDGSSGLAAVMVQGLGPDALHAVALQRLLDRSESLAAATAIGRAVIIPPTGNNLRDLFLVASVNGPMAQR